MATLLSAQKKLELLVADKTQLTQVKQDLDEYIDGLYLKLKNQETIISLEIVDALKASLDKFNDKEYRCPEQNVEEHTLPGHSKEGASLDARTKNYTGSHKKLDAKKYDKAKKDY